MTEPTEDREREALDWLSKGTALLEAADGPGSGKLNLWVRHQITPGVDLPPSELRRNALHCFIQASELIPDEFWIWFQIGWNLFAYEEDIVNRVPARAGARNALQKVLELRPHDPIAHLALAWLLYQDALNERPADTEWAQVIWQGAVGEHLRLALDWKRGAEAYSRSVFRQLAGDMFLADSFPTHAGDATLVRALEAMDDLVPADYRFAYCLLYAWHVEGEELFRRWLEEALRWPTDDNVAMTWVYHRLGRVVRRQGGPLSKVHQYLLAAGNYLLNLTEEERDSLCSRFPEEIVDWEWLGDLPGPSLDSTADELSLYLGLLETALALVKKLRSDYEDDELVLKSMGNRAAIAGHLLLELNDVPRAKHYLELSRDFERRLIECGSYIPDEDDEFVERGPSYWRVVAARALRDVSIAESDFYKAREENQRVLELLHRDRDALQWKVELEQLIRSDSHHVEELAQLLSLHEMTRLVLDEVVLQQGALEQLADLRRDVEEIAKARALDFSDMNALLDELHDIAQHQTRVSPAALQRARQGLVAELGEVTFGALQPESQHLLTTAEVLFSASEDLAELIDSGCIVVEYAKAVEAELRQGVLLVLAGLLTRMDCQDDLLIGRSLIEYRGRNTWRTRLPSLSLGAIANLLKEAMAGSENRKIKDILQALEPAPGWALQLADDIDTLASRYRNGAAHADGAVDRTALVELRALLLNAGLVSRIIELEGALRRA
jgi:hypothetical protein